MPPLTVIQCGQSPRLQAVLTAALGQTEVCFLSVAQAALTDLQNCRLLFAIAVGEFGIDENFCRLLHLLRSRPDCLHGCVGAVLMDGATELDTKQAARMLVFSANKAGCLFPGKPLVEGTGSLRNLEIQARKNGLSPEQTYPFAAQHLVEKLLTFRPAQRKRPRLLLLHASDHRTSNTLALGKQVVGRLSDCEITTLSVRNGAVHDCRGCSYTVCAHYAKNNSCFYGGAIMDEVFPALRQCDALLLLCPNYNDAVGANIMACINRMTSLMVSDALAGKYLYAIVVSGYSGGDLVAQQLLGALCLNKTLILPPDFCLMETANDPGSALHLPGIQTRLDAFAQNIRRQLFQKEDA